MLLERFSNYTEGRAALERDLTRCHPEDHVALIRDSAPGWLDGDTILTETSWRAALL